MAEVVEVRPDALILRTVAQRPPDRAAARAFGRALAATHDAGAPAYGSPPPGAAAGWIADLPLPYAAEPAFGPFYAACRVAPYVLLARDRGAIDAAQARELDAWCARVADGDPALVGPPEPPARLHGDLWSGNVLWAADGSGAVLVDPAAHGGHRETDLAMLALFGLPYLAEALAAYQETHPLAGGWRDRVPLHQVHPLLVHAALFGGRYGASAVAAARRCG